MFQVVDASKVNLDVELVSIDDLSAYLNLMYHDVVDVILEYITIFTDDEMIQEICNMLDLDVKCVRNFNTILGYITPANEGDAL